MTTHQITLPFITEVLKLLKQGDFVLDLGAGEGRQAERFMEAGAVVTAIDKKSDVKLKNIDWRKTSVQDFIADNKNNQKYGIIFSQNLLQFLDKAWVFSELFPWLNNHLEPSGIIAIKTFYQEPEPAFSEPLVSLYNAEELQKGFADYQVILKNQAEVTGPDMKGKIRKFFITKLIIQKAV